MKVKLSSGIQLLTRRRHLRSMRMKRRNSSLASIALIAVLAMAGCGKSDEASAVASTELIGMKLPAAQRLAKAHGHILERVGPFPPYEAVGGFALPPKAIYVETNADNDDSTVVRVMKLRCSRPHYKGKCAFVPAN
jgi:hypothetical protein